MQIVLSGNRVIAHGENCFLSMGGTVICEETGKAYQNATIAECENCPADIGSVGYEYHAGVFVPVAPYGKTEGGYLMAACYECATPRTTDILLEDVSNALETLEAIPTKNIANGAITADKLAANAVSQTYTATVPASGWTVYSNGQAVQNVAVSGLLTSDSPIIDVDLSTASNITAYIELEEEWSKVVRVFVQSANTLRFNAKEAPSIDLPVKLVVIRK